MLITVYLHQERFDELLEILDNPDILAGTRFIKGTATFERLRLDILENAGREKAIYDSCVSVLEKLLESMESPTGQIPLDLVWVDDFGVWVHLIDAVCSTECSQE